VTQRPLTTQHPNAELDVFITDLNGQQRGKRVRATAADTLIQDGFKLPRSIMGMDFWGDDVLANGLVFETGDNDGWCHGVAHTLHQVPWEQTTHFQMIAMMSNADGTPFAADPRQVLTQVLARYQAMGLRPVVAAELEFYLLDLASEQAGRPIPSPLLPQTGFDTPNAYGINDLERFQPILAAIRAACAAQAIPTEAIIAELGDGHFEVNLLHGDDALLAADQTILFKRTVRHVARQHGHLASFMAKTYGNNSGSGFHLHVSLLDSAGQNVFANGTAQGSATLQHAVGGLLQAMPAAMLIFAPHLNSYRRLQAGSHAPTSANWAYENRTVAVRIPDSSDQARRFEHRVAGADANPYLVMAAVLAAALHGIQQQSQAGEAVVGNGYSAACADEALPCQWTDATHYFRQSALMQELLGAEFVKVFSAVKDQEIDKLAHRVTDAEYATYLGTV